MLADNERDYCTRLSQAYDEDELDARGLPPLRPEHSQPARRPGLVMLFLGIYVGWILGALTTLWVMAGE